MTIGNENFEAMSGDADKLARALEVWLFEGKIKVHCWEVFNLRIGLLVPGTGSAPTLWCHTDLYHMDSSVKERRDDTVKNEVKLSPVIPGNGYKTRLVLNQGLPR